MWPDYVPSVASRSDTAVMLMTFAVTMLTTHTAWPWGLAGVALAALLFSRKVAKVIRVEAEDISADHRRYRVTGQLFFVSKVCFLKGSTCMTIPPRSPLI